MNDRKHRKSGTVKEEQKIWHNQNHFSTKENSLVGQGFFDMVANPLKKMPKSTNPNEKEVLTEGSVFKARGPGNVFPEP